MFLLAGRYARRAGPGLPSHGMQPPEPRKLRPFPAKLLTFLTVAIGVLATATFVLLLTNPADLLWAWVAVAAITALAVAAITVLLGVDKSDPPRT